MESIQKSLDVLQQESREMQKKLSTIHDDLTFIKQSLLEMNNHMIVLLNPQIYNPSREYDPTREMITGIIDIEYK